MIVEKELSGFMTRIANSDEVQHHVIDEVQHLTVMLRDRSYNPSGRVVEQFYPNAKVKIVIEYDETTQVVAHDHQH